MELSELRFLFMGTPMFAAPTLERLVEAGLECLGVWTQPDRPKGRGQQLAMSAVKDRSNAERLAAVVSGMTSLAGGAAASYSLGGLNRVIVDMADGYLLITAISSGSVLGVIADRSAHLGTIAYEMTLFASRAGAALTPNLIIELKNAVQQ